MPLDRGFHCVYPCKQPLSYVQKNKRLQSLFCYYRSSFNFLTGTLDSSYLYLTTPGITTRDEPSDTREIERLRFAPLHSVAPRSG